MGKLINRDDQKAFRKKLRNEPTAAETTLWKFLRNKQLEGLKFRRQQGFGSYIVDFYCPELQLVIELDGENHFYSEEYDDARTQYLQKEAGITVMRFENKTVFMNLDLIISEILEYRDKKNNL
ncbi:endonuclease domain-containing protein [Bacteroides sp. 519]|uniref:endonuclease domain-containing protein n=1 Tax=Bacteroides sp. 519 TaxID=2302937 RepID=UPI0013D102CC|nr:DUF559 domain-containing protein [Bacteroides sp. 519]NDV58919.1 endonuclease domain-containing protein [Bacteroides sp. 519]